MRRQVVAGLMKPTNWSHIMGALNIPLIARYAETQNVKFEVARAWYEGLLQCLTIAKQVAYVCQPSPQVIEFAIHMAEQGDYFGLDFKKYAEANYQKQEQQALPYVFDPENYIRTRRLALNLFGQSEVIWPDEPSY